MSGIVWLASYPKSGNTWLRSFLINLIADRGEPVPLDEYKRFITGEASAQWHAPRLGGKIDPRQRVDVARHRPAAQADIAKTGRPFALVKTHNFLGQVFGHPQINMDVTAAAIYVVRNPLDVAISFASHNATSIDAAIDLMAQQKAASSMRPDRVFEATSDWSTHVASWTAREHGTLCVLRYEDMLDDAPAAFSRVSAFLKITDDRERIERAIEFSSFDRLRSLESESGFDERPAGAPAFFRVGQKEQWRDVLSEEQKRRIIARHRDQMKRFGYA